ncbi:MAG TPA: polyphosphate kinase 1 [Gemmatimonadaceae bacterium]|nr:polyphosphate kinase 1 [Gemmatimonadaceae bacterium]
MSDLLNTPQLYINRELSWLEFNARVLHEAFDRRNPLLERLKFISIFSTNLDEFYMVRVAGLRRQVAANVTAGGPDGLTPQEQLDAIARRAEELLTLQRQCLHDELLPELASHGVRLVSMRELDPKEWSSIDAFFETQAFPVLTPLAVDPGHPFPYISNLSLSLAVRLRDPLSGQEHFARVKVPRSLPRWIPFGRPHCFVPLEQVIGANLGALFPGMEIRDWHAFRITRNSDIELSAQEEPDDLLATIEEQVFRRRFGEVVRLEVEDEMPAEIRSLLIDELRDDRLPMNATLSERDVHAVGSLLELGDLMEIACLDIPELRDPPFVPTTPPRLRDVNGGIFEAIKEGDILVHHPFDSFAATVEHFLQRAAQDDQVLAIKLTLYRTSGDTPIVRALVDAAERGKQVAVLVELKARFDEANNISWARQLESAGVHVVYGLVTLKTHSKTCLVVRREADGIRRYVHFGTGNYNSRTARLYTDLGLFTCAPSIGADLSDLFNYLTGFSHQRVYRKLLVAPGNMRDRFVNLIERETQHALAGRPARIIGKMNALVDPDAIRALYRASQAGVEIDLIVRGICCLRPGIDGVSDRIRVMSVVGRFLEHSRCWYFQNGGEEEYYIGSADWMPRNFDRRVEAVVPIDDPALHSQLRSLLDTYLHDNRQAWVLDPDGTYHQRLALEELERSAQVICQTRTWGEMPAAPEVAPVEQPPVVERQAQMAPA